MDRQKQVVEEAKAVDEEEAQGSDNGGVSEECEVTNPLSGNAPVSECGQTVSPSPDLMADQNPREPTPSQNLLPIFTQPFSALSSQQQFPEVRHSETKQPTCPEKRELLQSSSKHLSSTSERFGDSSATGTSGQAGGVTEVESQDSQPKFSKLRELLQSPPKHHSSTSKRLCDFSATGTSGQAVGVAEVESQDSQPKYSKLRELLQSPPKHHSSTSKRLSDCSATGTSGKAGGVTEVESHDSYLCHETGEVFTCIPPAQDESNFNADGTVPASREMTAEQQTQTDLWCRLSLFFLNFHARTWFGTDTGRSALDEQLKRFTRYAIIDVVILVSWIIAGISKLRQSSTVSANDGFALTVILSASAMMMVISFFHVMDFQEKQKSMKNDGSWKNHPNSSATTHELFKRMSLIVANVDACLTEHKWKVLYLPEVAALLGPSHALKSVPYTITSSKKFSTIDTIINYLKMATHGSVLIDTVSDSPDPSDPTSAENLSSETNKPSETIPTTDTESVRTQNVRPVAREGKSDKESSIAGQYEMKDDAAAQEKKGYVSGAQPGEGCSQRFNIREPRDNIKSKAPAAETSQDPGPSTSYSNTRRENTASDAWIDSTLEYVANYLLPQSSGIKWKMGQSSCYVYTERTAKKPESTKSRDTSPQNLEKNKETVASPVATKERPHKQSEESIPSDVRSVPGTLGAGGQKQENLDAKDRCESQQPLKTASSTPMETRASRRKRSEAAVPSGSDIGHKTPDKKSEAEDSNLYRYKKRSKVPSKDEIEASTTEAGKSDSPLLKDRLRPRTPKHTLGKRTKTEQSDKTPKGAAQFSSAAPDLHLHKYIKRQKSESHEKADLVLDPAAGIDASIETEDGCKDSAAPSAEASVADKAKSSMDRLKELCKDWEIVFVISGPADTEYVIHKIPDGECPINECRDITPPPEVELVLKMLDIVNETSLRIKQAAIHKYIGKISKYTKECSAIKKLLRNFADILSSAVSGDVTPLEPFRQAYTMSFDEMQKFIQNLNPLAALALLSGNEVDFD